MESLERNRFDSYPKLINWLTLKTGFHRFFINPFECSYASVLSRQ